MSTMRILTAAAFATVIAVSTASAQQQTQRVAGTIDKVEGNTLYIKSASGPVSLTLADNALIVARVKASAADIKAGDYVATGGVPQPDGTQKAVELRIFPESMRGNGEGHRPGWPGAPNGTMTNGGVGQTVSSVDGPVLTVKLKDGDKKIIVGPSVRAERRGQFDLDALLDELGSCFSSPSIGTFAPPTAHGSTRSGRPPSLAAVSLRGRLFA